MVVVPVTSMVPALVMELPETPVIESVPARVRMPLSTDRMLPLTVSEMLVPVTVTPLSDSLALSILTWPPPRLAPPLMVLVPVTSMVPLSVMVPPLMVAPLSFSVPSTCSVPVLVTLSVVMVVVPVTSMVPALVMVLPETPVIESVPARVRVPLSTDRMLPLDGLGDAGAGHRDAVERQLGVVDLDLAGAAEVGAAVDGAVAGDVDGAVVGDGAAADGGAVSFSVPSTCKRAGVGDAVGGDGGGAGDVDGAGVVDRLPETPVMVSVPASVRVLPPSTDRMLPLVRSR